MNVKKRRISTGDVSVTATFPCRRKKKRRHEPDWTTEPVSRTTKPTVMLPTPCLALRCVNYNQASMLLRALELNRRGQLDPRCIAHMANYVVRTWEVKPEREKEHQIIGLMNSLLRTTAVGLHLPLHDALKLFCANTVSTRTPCPAVTLLMTMYYIQRLDQKHAGMKGTPGCGSRLILAAYITASKFLQNNLRLITNTTATPLPSSPPPSPQPSPSPSQPTCSERNARILRMTVELLHFLDYDLSIADPTRLVEWSQRFYSHHTDDYTSGDEGGDELSDTDDDSDRGENKNLDS